MPETLKARYSAVLLDYYGTIAANPYEAMTRIALRHGIAARILIEAIIPGEDGEARAWIDMEMGRLHPRVYWARVVDYVERQTAVALDLEEIGSEFIKAPVDDEVFELIKQLVDSGLPVGIITNGYHWDDVHDNLNRLSELGAHIFASDKLGMRKPEPHIYRFALSEMGSEAPTTLYLDDNEAFLAGGTDTGLVARLVDSPRDTASVLKDLVAERRSRPAESRQDED